MGVRLVVNGKIYSESSGNGGGNGYGTVYHDELENRDLINQHPISAITGLKEVIHNIENNIFNLLTQLQQEKTNLQTVQNLVNTLNNNSSNYLQTISTQNTSTVNLSYSNKILSANARIYNATDNSNALKIVNDSGLYVPKIMTSNTSSITWGNLSSTGETQYNIYTNGTTVFGPYHPSYTTFHSDYITYSNNHITNYSSNIFFVGKLSQYSYKNYEWSCELYRESTNGRGELCLFLAGAYDSSNTLHYLCLIIGGQQWSGLPRTPFSIKYDCYKSRNYDGITLAYIPNTYFNYNNNISGTGPIYSIYVKKQANIIDVYISNRYEHVQVDNVSVQDVSVYPMHMSINTNDYSYLGIFENEVKYGIGFFCGEQLYIDNIHFHSDASISDSTKYANVNISNQSNNAISIKSDGLYSPAFLVSSEANNALTLKSDGYYADIVPVNISNQRLNGLEEISTNEYYVHKSHSFITVNQDDHEFIVGDFIYYDGQYSEYRKAIAIDSFDINIVGMVSHVYDTDKFEYICSGFVETNLFNTTNGYIQGMPLYISDTYSGKVTQEQPDISKAVGYPVEDIGLIISIERGIQYDQEAQIGDFKTSASDYNIRSDGFIKIAENINYKLSLVNKLLNNIDNSFKEEYITIDETNNTLKFINTEDLYISNGVPNGLNLYIKAF